MISLSAAPNDLKRDSSIEGEGHRDLDHLERRLTKEVDADLFQDPKSFRTLQRVIDIFGAQLIDEKPQYDENAFNNPKTTVEHLSSKNPAFMALLQQRALVESCIEHMAIKHCSELNGSVTNVGSVARQFSDAVFRVRNLRKQVKDIKRQLHHSKYKSNEKKNLNETTADRNETTNSKTNDSTNGNLNSTNYENATLRELWLKKLESEAVLTLLSKLEIIREAPTAFDSLIMPRSGQCRIGAAVTLLSNAINTMFSDDVAQIQALTKIMDQLMTRKQKAEEIVWDTLNDVIYLRTGNSVNPTLHFQNSAKNPNLQPRKDISAVPGGSCFHRHKIYNHNEDDMSSSNIENDNDDDSVASTFSGFSNPSTTDSHSSPHGNSGSQSNSMHVVTGRLIPQSVMETDLDLEEDELFCLEEDLYMSRTGMTGRGIGSSSGPGRAILPRYSDATQALRILVESVAKLGRLDDMERFLNESLEREIRGIAEREQQNTLNLLEKRKKKRLKNRDYTGTRDTAATTLPYEFKYHMGSLLYAFGNVMLRLSHLAQILRAKIVSLNNFIFLLFYNYAITENLFTYFNRTPFKISIRPQTHK